MEWEDFSEEIQELFELTDNWIDDVGNVYDYVSDKNIDEYIFERRYEELEYLYKLKYGYIPDYWMLEDFYFIGEYKEVKYNYEYFKKNEIKFKHGVLRSKGEKYLYDILMKEKVKFVFGESDGCKNNKTNKFLWFDFIIFYKGKKIYIEIQGEQHYRYNPYFHKDYKDFEERLYKDTLKKQFAENNGIYVSLDYSNSDLNYLDKQIREKILPLIRSEKNVG